MHSWNILLRDEVEIDMTRTHIHSVKLELYSLPNNSIDDVRYFGSPKRCNVSPAFCVNYSFNPRQIETNNVIFFSVFLFFFFFFFSCFFPFCFSFLFPTFLSVFPCFVIFYFLSSRYLFFISLFLCFLLISLLFCFCFSKSSRQPHRHKQTVSDNFKQKNSPDEIIRH